MLTLLRCTTAMVITMLVASSTAAEPWPRHVIDASLRGADGVRLADFNDDGWQDVVTGWEESGVVRLYLNPGPDRAKQPWPAVTVGNLSAPEDAVPFDFDGDGKLDVISCHEGKAKRTLVHFYVGKHTDGASLLEQKHWRSQPIGQIAGQMWMFATPITLAVRNDEALVVGSKGKEASITLLVPPKTGRQAIANWHAIKLRDAGWIMTLNSIDMDSDGDDDLVISDRKGSRRAVAWLEQPGDLTAAWVEHPVGATEGEPLFIDVQRDRILATTRNAQWIDFRRTADEHWESMVRENPRNVPYGKAIARLDETSWVMTANTAADGLKEPRPGIWLQRDGEPWQAIDRESKTKFDRIECLDLDDDGDLDVMTCEERRNLGVIWYENPGGQQ